MLEEPGGVFVYAGSGHLFADEDSEDFDAASAELMFEQMFIYRNSLGCYT